MVSLETIQATFKSIDPISSPRISFSTDFLNENNFISICPNPQAEAERDRAAARNAAEFEFLSCNLSNMMSADELFCKGKLLPFWQIHQAEKLSNINLKTENSEQKPEKNNPKIEDETKINWFIDDDPSPRPPKCTVLWKELLRLKKHRASALSPSSSSSSSRNSVAEIPLAGEKKDGMGNREKSVKRIKKGLERTRSASIRIKPVINVPICAQWKSNALSPLFSLRKGRLERLKM